MPRDLYIGRRKPYTAIGIRRRKCARCGAPSIHQFSVCANGSRQVPVCVECDIALNDIALRFFRHPHRRELMARYRAAARGAR